MKHRLYLFFMIFLPTLAYSQLFGSMDILQADMLASVNKVMPGSSYRLAVRADIQESFHINSHTPREEFLIPTVLEFSSHANVSFDNVHYPEHELREFGFSEEKVAVYEGETVFWTEFSISDQFASDSLTINATLSYQGCDDNSCYAPQSVDLTMVLPVTESGQSIEWINKDLFGTLQATPSKGSESPDEMPLDFTADELRAKQIIEKGLIYALAAFFLVGLALNLTPCVYPVIPLTVGYFGGAKDTSRTTSFINALMYLLGIAISFSLLGLVSGLAGKQWGFLFASPWFVVAIAVIILSMSASLFGAFEITVPSSLLTKLGATRQGVVGALIMGLTVGVVIAPCAAGIIIGLVGLVAKLGLVVKGTLLFFVMGLGLGLPYLILATFSGLLSKLPQSGMWMVWVRKLFGIMLIGVALYFLMPQLERIHDKLGFLLGLLTLFGGLLLGFLDHAPGYTRGFKIGRAIFGVILIFIGIHWIHDSLQAKESQIDWIHYSGQPLESLIENEKPTFIDFYADWCAPCKQLDRETFTDESVAELSRQFNMIKVDCTAPDQATLQLMKRFEVTGMPTLVFLDKEGNPQPDMREIGFIGPEIFIGKMQKLLD
jgi:thiol:disulfide interchange protein DsbD